MMNLESFHSALEDISLKTSNNFECLETPFLESSQLPQLNCLLKKYYHKNFEQSLSASLSAVNQFNEDACLYNLVACSFAGMGEKAQASEFFDVACQIIYSYHAVYHFVGYVLYHNRATLHHIMGKLEMEKQDLAKAQFLYHENNPNRNIAIIIDDQNLHFKNPTKDMLPKQKTTSHLSIFQNSTVDGMFWKSLNFFEKRQWSRSFKICDLLIKKINYVHLEYHYFAACIFYNRGMNHVELSNYDFAIDDFSKAITFDSGNPRNHLYKQALHKAQKMIK
ncbi:MAG: tetratricopeptide (TPR) repeat protein [Candidatus Deianiraeaceae bacterium]|jgi:tetratricopeptide (TPR) repeat protein